MGHAQWNTERILAIGRNALYFEDYVLSIQYFNQVIRIKPYMAEPYMYRAMAKIQLGDDQGAEVDASEAIDRNPFLPQAYYIRGFARRKLNNFKGALADFSKAYEFSPDNTNLLMNRMDTYIRLEDYKSAMKDLETCMRLNPKLTNLYYEKGFIQLSLKDTTAAENSFVKLTQADSTNTSGWSALALLKMQKQDENNAYKYYSQAIKFNSSFSGDYINRGILNVDRKNFRQALTDYDKAIELDKKSDLAYYNRALLRANLGDNNNALADLNKVLELDSTNLDAVYRRAMLNNTLKLHRNAIKDFNTIIGKYPYFIPAFLGIAEAYDGLGNGKESFRYRQMAYEIDKNKDNIKKKMQLAANKMAKNSQQSTVAKKTEVFNRYITEDIDDSQSDSKYQDSRRGNVQDKYADVVNEKNFVLTYYTKADEIRRTNLYEPLVEAYNNRKVLPAALKITNNEISLTSELINQHFDEINNISSKISTNDGDADLYFERALEFALVQDYSSAVEDLNKAIALRSDFALAYFCRANLKYKLVDSRKNMPKDDIVPKLETAADKAKRISDDAQNKYDVEMVMRDYDKVIELDPGFSFAYYNKANILCSQRDFSTAISYYSKAIGADGDFAEAYFNRALTYLFIGDNDKGLVDLSKAGELGIYQSYNLLQRFGAK